MPYLWHYVSACLDLQCMNYPPTSLGDQQAQWLGKFPLYIIYIEVSHTGPSLVLHLTCICHFYISKCNFCINFFVFMINSAVVRSGNICTSLLMSECRSALDMLVTTLYLPSFVLIAQEGIIASSDTVEDLFYDVVVQSLCDLLLAHLLCLMVLSRSFSRTKGIRGIFPLFPWFVLLS